jgi:hypothetical protein
MDSGSMDRMPGSREAMYSDQAAHGFSPERISDLLGGVKVTPASYPQAGGGGGGPGSGSSAGVPQHVTDFEAILKQTLFPNDPVIQAVQVEDLTPRFHFFELGRLVRDIYRWLLYGAWTDSATKILVKDPAEPPLTPDDVDDLLTVTAFHEAVHLRDFAKTGRPTTYAQMMRYECKAYESTGTWLGTTQANKLLNNSGLRVANRTLSNIMARAFKAEIASVKTKSPAEQEAAFKDFLMGNNTIRKQLRDAKVTDASGDGEMMLPPHKAIADLYGP